MCGIFGVIGHKQAGQVTYLGLYALQHRGEESAGIVVFNDKDISSHKGMGLGSEVFDEKIINSFSGDIVLGYVRYSTTGSSIEKNIQPFVVYFRKGYTAIAHNGNITNIAYLHNRIEKEGSIFQTTMDSEIIAHLIARAKGKDIEKNIIQAFSQLEGAYSVIMVMNKTFIGVRDPYGFRPLCIGRLEGAYILSSETCALDLIGADYLREIEPGELVFITNRGINSFRPFVKSRRAFCIFEYIYFARPDSNVFGKSVYLIRKSLGERLAKEASLNDCDFIMPIPDSGNYAALGFSQVSGLKLELGIVRNHYIGRTFIQPMPWVRDFKVRVKLNPIRDLIKGKKVGIIEDSIVRGTTSKVRVRTLRKIGAKEIHMRVSSPPIKYPCFFGIDFPQEKELIASRKNLDEIQKFIGLDSLYYLSKDGMLEATSLSKDNFCTACFDNNYPIKPKKFYKGVLER
ncbi:MAG: amidophosphoribosyltransferase [Candidatus Omnitrophica bacterium]|nr:amidophosphoribosyltransferase [Candidatus Omnitrophota bacterium]